jgi:hypothetical protein
MAEDEEINYVKEVLKSNWNLAYIGIMGFLMLVVNFWGFLPLLAAGELAGVFLAQNSRIQRIIRSRKNKDQKIEVYEAEGEIVRALPANYQNDFNSVRGLCDEIERRSQEQDAGARMLIGTVVEKLSAFRFEYARMLRAHFLLSTRNYRNLQGMLTSEIANSERALNQEQSPQVHQALAQNLKILKQRLDRIGKLDELVRLLEARLRLIKNSLSLIQDEMYTFTDVAGISGLVDDMLTNMSLSDEFRTAYEDVLSAESSSSKLSALEEGERPNQSEAGPPRRPRQQVRQR